MLRACGAEKRIREPQRWEQRDNRSIVIFQSGPRGLNHSLYWSSRVGQGEVKATLRIGLHLPVRSGVVVVVGGCRRAGARGEAGREHAGTMSLGLNSSCRPLRVQSSSTRASPHLSTMSVQSQLPFSQSSCSQPLPSCQHLHSKQQYNFHTTQSYLSLHRSWTFSGSLLSQK